MEYYHVGNPGGVNLYANATTIDSGGASGGTGGNGGDWKGWAGGGAGWLSNGKGSDGAPGGNDLANHFAITIGYYGGNNVGNGGYGGGGASTIFQEGGNTGHPGGGGGGYNGGGAGGIGGGGGGGSYLNGILAGSVVASNVGNGSISISYLLPSAGIEYPCDGPTIGIYPNPNSGVFFVTGVMPEQILDVYNYLGQKLNASQINNTFMQLDLSDYANGVYLVVVHNADGSKAGEAKVVKAK